MALHATIIALACSVHVVALAQDEATRSVATDGRLLNFPVCTGAPKQVVKLEGGSKKASELLEKCRASLAVEPVGWASIEGYGVANTVGGGNAEPVTVSTLDELKRTLADKAPRVVVVSGTISTGPQAVVVKSNKTLMGLDKKATIFGGLTIKSACNIVVKNLNLQGAGVGNDPADAIAARDSHHLWFDHLNVWDSRDGNLDLTLGSDLITVSWCKFWYTDPNNPHRLSCLVGGGSTHGNTDKGRNRVTFHHNWFADLVRERMPRVLFGQAHVFNNCYTCTGNNYCIGAGSMASVLIENNFFKNVKDPHKFADSFHTSITAKDNAYESAKGRRESGIAGAEGPVVQAFERPPYSYKADPAADVLTLVMKGAGPQ